MATATGYTPFNMDEAEAGAGDVTIFTSTHIQVAEGGDVRNYYGSGFAVDIYGNLIGGTLTSMNNLLDGVLQIEITGLSHSMVTFNNYLLANDVQGALGYLFSGNDSLIGSPGDDVANAYSGNDYVSGNEGNDVGRGGDGNDTLVGGMGNDTVVGGTGTDSLVGGVGDDTYVLEDSFDTMVEAAGEGTDLVQSSNTYTLGAELENLTLLGAFMPINGTGNAANNVITGNYGNNVLDGGPETIRCKVAAAATPILWSRGWMSSPGLDLTPCCPRSVTPSEQTSRI